MNKITLKGKEYNMPSSWKDVKLKTYIELSNIDTGLSKIKNIVTIISILANIPIKELYKVDFTDITKIDVSFIGNTSKEIDKVIEIDNTKYGVVKDMKKLSLGEYVDLDHYATTGKDIHKVVAILMRPITAEDENLYTIEEYDAESLEVRAEVFLEKMNVSQLLGLSNFFSTSVSGFLENMSSYSQQVN